MSETGNEVPQRRPVATTAGKLRVLENHVENGLVCDEHACGICSTFSFCPNARAAVETSAEHLRM